MVEDADPLAESVIADIRRAFSGVSREDGVSLHEALTIDAYGSKAERTAARALDPDQRWDDVPDRLIEEHDSPLCFVDPKGFRYYLPAYMVWSLRNYNRAGDFESWSHNHPICSLVLSESEKLRQWDLDRFKVLNGEQAKAICRFLRFMAQQDELLVCVEEARKALDAYWGKFCAETDSADAPVSLTT